MFVRSHGARIAYDVNGEGSPLVLLHGGFIQSRQVWHEHGYIERFSHNYTVITIDLRGHGESDISKEPDGYQIGKIIGDVHAVAEICKVEKFLVWGFSLGATIALQLAARSDRVSRAVIAGSFFGKSIREYASRNIASLEAVIKARAEGRIGELFLTSEERSFVESIDLELALAVYKAITDWPVIRPQDLRCPAFVYVGSADEPIIGVLREQRVEIEKAGIRFKIFDGLNHFEEITATDAVLPDVLEFLNEGDSDSMF